MSWTPEHNFDTEKWHEVEQAAFDVNHLYETVETEEAKDHIQDAVRSLQSALRVERNNDD